MVIRVCQVKQKVNWAASEKQRHHAIFHHDYKPEKTFKRARRNHQCNYVENDKECCLLFLSLKKLQAHRKLKNNSLNKRK